MRASLTSQKKNPLGAWRYSPQSNDADTSVSGSVLVGLLAARNAGIEVPDEVIDKAISYYTKMTSTSGEVGYLRHRRLRRVHGPQFDRDPSVYALSRRKDLPEFKSALGYLTSSLD